MGIELRVALLQTHRHVIECLRNLTDLVITNHRDAIHEVAHPNLFCAIAQNLNGVDDLSHEQPPDKPRPYPSQDKQSTAKKNKRETGVFKNFTLLNLGDDYPVRAVHGYGNAHHIFALQVSVGLVKSHLFCLR